MSAGAATPEQPLVYVVLVNWNGWADTLECLESLFRSAYAEYRVIVCDNGSSDGSLERIKAWAEGELPAPVTTVAALQRFTSPPVAKPLRYRECSRAEAERGEGGDAPLTLVRVGANLGFAGGNNVGLRLALCRDDFSYLWLLNNDTVVTPDTLAALVRRLGEQPGAGICGSKLLYYREPGLVQGLGGARYNHWLGTNRHLGYQEPAQASRPEAEVEAAMDYVIGASMLVTRGFLRQVGLMCEEYFLYFEELDWAYRARGRFGQAYAAQSLVYHKEGGSAGSCAEPGKSKSVDYFVIRSRLLFTRSFVPWALPTVYLGLGCALINRMRRGQWDRIPMILGLAFASRRRLSALKPPS